MQALLKPRHMESFSIGPFLMKQKLWSCFLCCWLLSYSHPGITCWITLLNYATLSSCCLWEEVWNNPINVSPSSFSYWGMIFFPHQQDQGQPSFCLRWITDTPKQWLEMPQLQVKLQTWADQEHPWTSSCSKSLSWSQHPAPRMKFKGTLDNYPWTQIFAFWDTTTPDL